MGFEIATEAVSGLSVLRLKGRLDKESAGDLSNALDLAAATPALLVDLKDLAYLSSAGIHALLNAGQRLKSAQRTLALSSVRPELRQVLDEGGFGDTLKLFPTLDEAIAALKPAESHPLSEAAARLLGAAAPSTSEIPPEAHALAERAAAMLTVPDAPPRPAPREPLKETAINAPALPPSLPHNEPEPPPLPPPDAAADGAGMVGRLKGLFGKR
jgi:anti-sigma B factor antagonist